MCYEPPSCTTPPMTPVVPTPPMTPVVPTPPMTPPVVPTPPMTPPVVPTPPEDDKLLQCRSSLSELISTFKEKWPDMDIIISHEITEKIIN